MLFVVGCLSLRCRRSSFVGCRCRVVVVVRFVRSAFVRSSTNNQPASALSALTHCRLCGRPVGLSVSIVCLFWTFGALPTAFVKLCFSTVVVVYSLKQPHYFL